MAPTEIDPGNWCRVHEPWVEVRVSLGFVDLAPTKPHYPRFWLLHGRDWLLHGCLISRPKRQIRYGRTVQNCAALRYGEVCLQMCQEQPVVTCREKQLMGNRQTSHTLPNDTKEPGVDAMRLGDYKPLTNESGGIVHLVRVLVLLHSVWCL